MNEINEELSDFLNDFGIFLEEENNHIYIKYRLYPTNNIKQKCEFNENNKIEYEDIFYEYYNINKQCYEWNIERYYRERLKDNETIDIVKQTSRNINNKCHIYLEEHINKDTLTNENLQPFLKFKFTRIKSNIYEYIYMDSLIIPDINEPYEVISVKLAVTNEDGINVSIKKLFEIIYELRFEDNKILNKDYSRLILENENNSIFPMYSKFMYALQMSEFYEAYREFMRCDPVADTLEIRENIITNKNNLTTNSYDKKWIWFMLYQISYIRIFLEHFPNKKDEINRVRRIIEEKRDKVFKDPSIDLTEDEEDDEIY